MPVTIFGLGKKNSSYFPFHNVGRSDTPGLREWQQSLKQAMGMK